VFESIGKGAFGVVYRGVNAKTNETVAIKTFSSAALPQEELRAIEGEVGLMQKLNHPNIVKYIETIRTEETLNIIIEFVEKGSLSGLRKKNGGPFPESVIALYTAQVLEGLNYLHEQGVVHRDIKGANILLSKDGVIKLADFGVATQLDPSQKELSVVGTPYWMAPEIIGELLFVNVLNIENCFRNVWRSKYCM
jgi:serine/threonine protein kinase